MSREQIQIAHSANEFWCWRSQCLFEKKPEHIFICIQKCSLAMRTVTVFHLGSTGNPKKYLYWIIPFEGSRKRLLLPFNHHLTSNRRHDCVRFCANFQQSGAESANWPKIRQRPCQTLRSKLIIIVIVCRVKMPINYFACMHWLWFNYIRCKMAICPAQNLHQLNQHEICTSFGWKPFAMRSSDKFSVLFSSLLLLGLFQDVDTYVRELIRRRPKLIRSTLSTWKVEMVAAICSCNGIGSISNNELNELQSWQ